MNERVLLLVILCDAFSSKMPASINANELVNANFHGFFSLIDTKMCRKCTYSVTYLTRFCAGKQVLGL